MTSAEYAEVLSAAMTIRHELPRLLPADAEALGAALDVHIIRAEAAPAGERSAVLDEIIDLLHRREPTRIRLCELAPRLGDVRGVADSFWAQYQMLAGAAGGGDSGDEGVGITCKTCGYVNTLGVRPSADDPPVCQNPEPPRHLLAMT